ncbi:MAG: DUF6263 family protein [Myxococcota bacterium]
MKLRSLMISLVFAATAVACQKTPAPAEPAPGSATPAAQPAAAGEAKPAAGTPAAPGEAKPADPAQVAGAEAEKPPEERPPEIAPEAPQDQTAVAGVPLSEFPGLEELPDVRLVEEGSGEKKTLRYRYAAGSKHIMQMRMQMGMAMKVGERAMPPVELPAMLMRAEIALGQPDGDLMPYEFSIPTAPEVEPKEGTSEAVMAGLKTSMAAMTGLKGTASVDARGATHKGTFGLEGKDNPQLAQLVDSMGQSMRQMSIPLPEAAVGVGARWQARQRLQMGGMTLYQVGEYTLESIDGDTLKLKVKLSQLGPKQTMDPPGLPPGMTAELLDMRGSGEGSMEVVLTSLVPRSQVTVKSDTSMRMVNQGTPQEMTMSMTMGMTIKPGDAE